MLEYLISHSAKTVNSAFMKMVSGFSKGDSAPIQSHASIT